MGQVASIVWENSLHLISRDWEAANLRFQSLIGLTPERKVSYFFCMLVDIDLLDNTVIYGLYMYFICILFICILLCFIIANK